MKLSGLAIALSLGVTAVLSSCVPNPVNNEEPNRMVASPRVLHLTNPGDTATSDVSLTCGCPFELDSIFFLGDTNDIKYSLSDPLSAHVKPHSIHFFVPAGKPAGNYSAMMALYVLDDNNQKFYDTIRVSMP